MAQNTFTFGDFLLCSIVAWGFSIMPIEFAIRMKCGLITEHKTFIEVVFKFLLHISTELFTLSLVICSYGLNKLQFVGFHYQTFPYYSQNCRWRYQDLHTCSSYGLFGALQECLTNPLNLLLCCCWSSRSFCAAQTAFVFEFLFPAPNLLCCW